MKDYQPGVTAPPFHVYCRSTTVPYFDEQFDIGERAARDEETGKTYYIPDDMNYQEWKETFVDGGDKSGFDVLDDGSALHYTHHEEPEPPKPKKEYLTKKKLQAKIADAKAYADSLKINHFGNTVVIEIVNPVEYASYVEYGHRTANHQGWVQGRFMLTISEQEIQNIAPKVLESKIKKFLGECMK